MPLIFPTFFLNNMLKYFTLLTKMRYARYLDVLKLKSWRFTMLNGRAILLGILCVLFVGAAFGQEPSDSQFVTVVERDKCSGPEQ